MKNFAIIAFILLLLYVLRGKMATAFTPAKPTLPTGPKQVVNTAGSTISTGAAQVEQGQPQTTVYYNGNYNNSVETAGEDISTGSVLVNFGN